MTEVPFISLVAFMHKPVFSFIKQESQCLAFQRSLPALLSFTGQHLQWLTELGLLSSWKMQRGVCGVAALGETHWSPWHPRKKVHMAEYHSSVGLLTATTDPDSPPLGGS